MLFPWAGSGVAAAAAAAALFASGLTALDVHERRGDALPTTTSTPGVSPLPDSPLLSDSPLTPTSSVAPPVTSAPAQPPAPIANCQNHLLVDDFSTWADGVNSLNGATSDDQTMNATSAEGGILTFTPNSINVSYIYEQFECLDTQGSGYDSLSFQIKGPEAASVSVELQTVDECGGEAYRSFYYTVNGLSGSLQTIDVQLANWPEANLRGIVGVVWYGFSAGRTGADNEWQLDNIRFLCAEVAPPEDPEPTLLPEDPTQPSGPATTVTTTIYITVPGGGVTTTTATTTGGWSTPAPPTTTTRRNPWPTTTRRPIPPWWDDEWWRLWPQSEGAENSPATRTVGVETIQKLVARDEEPAAAECSQILIDDWVSQSRLTFLYYNALLKPTSDDDTMQSVVVKDYRVTLTPRDSYSYFYSQLGCVDARAHGGISLRIAAAAGTTFDVQLSSKQGECGTEPNTDVVLTTRQLGWTFNGREQLYSIPFSAFEGLDLSKFHMIFISNLQTAVTLGPVSLYCGSQVVEYTPPAVEEPTKPTATVPAPTSTATTLVIDQFADADVNALGQWHGADEGISLTFRRNTMTLQTNDSDLQWITQVTGTCRNLTEFDGSYLHIAYSGSNLFTVALQQHNKECSNDIYPYPETWDSLEAARYSTGSDIYIPMNHFNIDRSRTIGISLKGFYGGTASTTFSKIEIINRVPSSFKVPEKLPSGTFVFACKRPNSFAFAIDDGDPRFAAEVMRTIEEENILVTFFTVGAPLRDQSTNLSAIYNEMAAKGHQIALHSYTHPPLEGLPSDAAIDWEYSNDIAAVAEVFGGLKSRYFRPPFGTEGARMRQRLAALVEDPYIVQWSVDVEDWLWAESATPEKQLEAFRRDVEAGGDIVVMHYLYESTVSYLREFIQIAKATGKQLMRVDQCLMDPNAPPLPGA